MAALEVLNREPERVQRLARRCAYFLDLAEKAGLNTGRCSGTPVIPLIIGDSNRAMLLSATLLQAGIHVQPIIYPAVSEESARLRFFSTALHTEEQIEQTVATVAQVQRELG